MQLRVLGGDEPNVDADDDGDHPNPATRRDIATWLGSDPASLSGEGPPKFDALSLSQKEFAVVTLSPPALYYLSGRAGFGKSHLARFLVDGFRLMGQRVADTGTTATAAGNIKGVTLHRVGNSMATAHVLAAMDHVLRRASLPGKKRLPLRGRTIVAIGDLCQWLPVPLCLFGVVYNNCAAYVWPYGENSARTC